MTLHFTRHLLAAMLLLAASGSALAAPDDLAQAKPAIDRANADWLPAMKARSAERLAEAYAEDGVFVLSDGREIVGHAAILDFYRKRVDAIGEVVEGGIYHDGMTLARDGLIYEWGHGGSTTVAKDGRKTTSGGPFLTVWKRQADGRWQIVRNLVF